MIGKLDTCTTWKDYRKSGEKPLKPSRKIAQGNKPAKNDHIYHILCFCVCVQETWYNRIRNVTHDDRLLIKKR